MLQSISYVASRHRSEARLIMVFLRLVLIPMSVTLGYLLQMLTKAELSPIFAFGAISLYAMGWYFYPASNLPKKQTFWRRKKCDFILNFSSLLIWASVGGISTDSTSLKVTQPVKSGFLRNSPQAAMLDPSDRAYEMSVHNSTIQRWKHAAISWKNKRLGKMDKMEAEDAILLIFLIFAISIITVFVLGVIACSFSCSAHESLAFMIFFGGLSLFVAFCVLFWRKAKMSLRRIRAALLRKPKDDDFYKKAVNLGMYDHLLTLNLLKKREIFNASIWTAFTMMTALLGYLLLFKILTFLALSSLFLPHMLGILFVAICLYYCIRLIWKTYMRQALIRNFEIK